MHTTSRRGRSRPFRLTLALAGAAALAAVTSPPRCGGGRQAQPPKPTVVLVHGAFADASGWNDVTEKLQKRGYTVVSPPPTRCAASRRCGVPEVRSSARSRGRSCSSATPTAAP